MTRVINFLLSVEGKKSFNDILSTPVVNSFPGKIASSPATGTRSILLPRGLRIKGTGGDQKPVIKFVWP